MKGRGKGVYISMYEALGVMRKRGVRTQTRYRRKKKTKCSKNTMVTFISEIHVLAVVLEPEGRMGHVLKGVVV